MPRRSLLVRTAATVAAASLGFTALAGVPAASAAPVSGSSTAYAPDFYTEPDELPDQNGELVRSEPMPLIASVPDFSTGSMTPGQWPASAQRIMYRSTGAHGDPIAVSGSYFQPAAEWNGEGPRPIAVVAPGTMGQGNQCAASLAFTPGLMVDAEKQSMSAAYEYFSVYDLVLRGFGVVVTDYEGLGMPGLHTYMNREAQGHAVLDAARAASQVPGADVTDESNVVISGYSQGGAAAASAAELQPTYGPDVPLVGTAAGAPPADLLEVMPAIDGSSIMGTFGYAINSLTHSYPELEPLLGEYLSPEGLHTLERLKGECIPESVASIGFRPSTQLTADGRSGEELVAALPEVRERIEEQRIGLRPPNTPVQVFTGRHDDVIPFGQVRQMAVDWCEGGSDVSFAVDETPEVLPGVAVNHAAPMLLNSHTMVDYLADRAHGIPAPTNCGQF